MAAEEQSLMRHKFTIIGVVLLLAVAGYLAWQSLSSGGQTITADFTRAVGVHVGSDVRVLGVKVGQITAVEPQGTVVRVSMSVDDEYQIPADASAIVIPPSIVADRYIQLSPAYTGGQAMEAGTKIGVDRTVVPLELDEVYASLDEFTSALGEDGSLGELIGTARENLEGNGQALGDSLNSLSEVAELLNNHSDDLWSTVENLGLFTEALADSDAQVELFNTQLADVTTTLADERDTLEAVFVELTAALADISGFIDDNADLLVKNVEQLTDLTGVLAQQQEALIAIADYAPVALTNLDLAYNAYSGTLDTRDDLLGPYDPATFLCVTLSHAVGIEEIPQACFDLADAFAEGGLEMPAEMEALVGQTPSLEEGP